MAKRKSSKQTLNEMVEIDGRVDKKRPTSLDQIWGADGLSKYGTMDVDEYEKQLDDMMMVDLQNHARDVGLRPDVEPRVLRGRLLNEFKKHVASYQGASASAHSPTPRSVPANIAKILKAGA